MNARIALLLCACSTACAELPPVTGNAGKVSPDVPAVAPKQPPAAAATSYDMMKRIDQMQAEVQQLTGKVEEQTFQIEELKKQQKTMYTDFDDRVQSLENKPGSGQPSATPAATPPAGLAPTGPSAASAAPATPAPKPVPAPAPASTPTAKAQLAPANPSKNSPSDASGGMPANPAVPGSVASGASTEQSSGQVPEIEKQEYQQAYDDLRNGRTERAIAGFNAYIVSYPNSAYASNAQYWLGEAHRVNQDNAEARKAFNAVLESHPNSAKVPDALLKLGYIEMDENNLSKAHEILTRVTNEFPNSRAAGLAQKKLQTIDISAP